MPVIHRSARLGGALVLSTLWLSGCLSSQYNDLERAGIFGAAGGAVAAATGGNVGGGVLAGATYGALCDNVNIC